MNPITITVSDTNLDFTATESGFHFETLIDNITKRYERRVAMELDKADVHGEASKEEAF